MTGQIIDPTRCGAWDDLLFSHPDYSFFHSSIWAEVLKKSYVNPLTLCIRCMKKIGQIQ
jgi:hypothetical protein